MNRSTTRFLTVDSAGRVVLPREVRQQLGLRAGSRLTFGVAAGRIELTPEAVTDPVFGLSPANRAVLRPTGRALDAVAAIRAERGTQGHGREG